jgi:hypothetical protein
MKSKGTKKKGDLGPFFLQWKALEALKACSPYNEKMKNVGEITPSLFTQVRGEYLYEMQLVMCISKE